MLAALGGAVDLWQRQPHLVGEVALEQPMGADDLPRDALAFGRQLELLAAGHDQALVLHACEQLHEAGVAQTQRAAEGIERRLAAAILPVEQVLERVFDLRPVAQHAAPLHPASGPHRCQNNEHSSGSEIK